MDLNGDGKVDVLSGSYSRHDPDMAGLFQVLWGTGKGQFDTAKELCGTDGKPLIIPADKSKVTDKICTRPTAVDFDGDGDLDLVVGNFAGTFALFQGEGQGKFAPEPSWLEGEAGRLKVDSHGDPFFIDWDGDGDLDLLSGSAQGGVFLFRNDGAAKAPKFGRKTTLVASGSNGHAPIWGEDKLQGPQRDTRVWADDVNGDGKLDLLVGDACTVLHVAQGLDEAEARKRYEAWEKERQEAMTAASQRAKGNGNEVQKVYEEMEKKRDAIAREERTGFVWLLLGK